MKKIIAKEFLFLISILTISLFTFPFTYGYNVFLSKQKKILEDSIQNTPVLWELNYNSLHIDYNMKFSRQEILYRVASDYYNNVGYDKEFYSSFKLWNNLKMKSEIQTSESLYNDYRDFILFYNNQWYIKNNFEKKIPTNSEGFKQYIEYNLVTDKDIKNNKLGWEHEAKRNDIQKRIYILIGKMLNEKKQINIALLTFYILFFLLFIIRYLIISVKWSINQIKS